MTDTDEKPTALEDRVTDGDRQFSPSAARNKTAIRDVFLRTMPTSGRMLEVGGGSGEHAVEIASAAPGLEWRTGDPSAEARRSIAAWVAHYPGDNIIGPHAIDVTADDWGVGAPASFDGVVSINMIHIAPYAAAHGLFAGAARYLKPGGRLFLYGPFSRDGVHTAPSNADFNANLKMRDPAWGVRDIEQDLLPLGQKHAISVEEIVEMPANNFSLIWRKAG